MTNVNIDISAEVDPSGGRDAGQEQEQQRETTNIRQQTSTCVGQSE